MARALILALIGSISFACSTSPGPAEKQRVDLIILAVPQTEEGREVSEARGSHYVVSTQGQASTQAAREMLDLGGNVIDAAVAASFAISVERPQSTGLGGGGFLLFHDAKKKKTYAVDFRERAPAGAREKMFQGPDGEVVPKSTTQGIQAVAVPGLIAGLWEIQAKWGKLPWKKVIEPAIRLAENGFEVYPHLAEKLAEEREHLASIPATRAVFFREDGAPLTEGDVLKQPDLAKTLKEIAEKGRKAFYQGRIARAIESESRRLGGLLGSEDLRSYRVHWRKPVRGKYKGLDVISMPPPSSGGTHLIQILNILEFDSLKELGMLTTQSIHRTASAMQLAFADRAEHMGDPDFVPVPVEGLISKKYARTLRSSIDPARARPSDEISAGKPPRAESTETTHFSIMDAEGNAVASTQTINGYFGSGVVVPGTGIVLNNTMDDFSAKPGASNLFGSVGGNANAIAPHKTPLSSMTPTLVLRKGVPVMAVGAPGGTRIIGCVAQTFLNYFEYRLPLYESVGLVRFHHQWKPDELKFDAPGPGDEVVEELKRLGHSVKLGFDAVPCRVMAVVREGASLIGVSDPRDAGSSAAR